MHRDSPSRSDTQARSRTLSHVAATASRTCASRGRAEGEMARSEAAAAATGGVAGLCSVTALSGAGDAGVKGSGALLNLGIGAGIQCLEAASLGMPFEVWKTRMGRYRHESTVESFLNVYKTGGARAFWAGLGPKMVESATKGAILMASKEAINESLLASGVGPTTSGLLAGAGGGVCQVVVMGPCTFLVTGAVTGDKSMSTMERIRRTYTRSGIRGFYPGASAIAFRQATNWASRQGFTEFARGQIKTLVHGDAADAKLTPLQEVAAGVIGGTMACWNHPFEVARIEMQARGDQGQKSINLAQTLRLVVQEHGVGGLFKGIVPRICLGVYQTLFMVTGAKLIKNELHRAGVL